MTLTPEIKVVFDGECRVGRSDATTESLLALKTESLSLAKAAVIFPPSLECQLEEVIVLLIARTETTQPQRRASWILSGASP